MLFPQAATAPQWFSIASSKTLNRLWQFLPMARVPRETYSLAPTAFIRQCVDSFYRGCSPAMLGTFSGAAFVEEADISPADRAMIFDHLTFCFAEREMMLCIPIPAHGADHRRCCFVWYRTADEEIALR